VVLKITKTAENSKSLHISRYIYGYNSYETSPPIAGFFIDQ